LRGDAAFFSLLLRTAITLGTAEGNHRVGSGPGLGIALDRIPQEVAGDEDVGSSRKSESIPSLIVTIHSNYSAFSANGLPSSSG
jgi:hypothetical protein